MKKLMILAAAVVTTVAANAAAITWGSGTITLPGGDTAGKDAVTAYLFMVDKSTYDTFAAYTDATKLSDDIYSAYKGSLGSADATKTSSKKGAATLNSGADYASGNYYAVVLYTATESATDYWMGNYATASIESTMDVSVENLATNLGGSGSATAWSSAAVPEPTSGLLLLLGMAGLALKRKRA